MGVFNQKLEKKKGKMTINSNSLYNKGLNKRIWLERAVDQGYGLVIFISHFFFSGFSTYSDYP